MTDLKDYSYGGARALVILHERQLRKFVVVWRHAKAAEVELPATDDPDYASLEILLCHVLRCARGYMVWMCKVLGLPDPDILEAPEPTAVDAEAESYVEHVVERWRSPLIGLTEDQAYRPTYTSPWGVEYCIDAMLEHAAMHPLRHRFQLEELIARAQRATGRAATAEKN